MTIDSMDDLVAALATARKPLIWKQSLTSKSAGVWHSTWKGEGYPRAGATPALMSAGGEVPTKSTTGAWPHTNAPSGYGAALARLTVALGQIGTVRILDRLWQCSGLSGSSTSSQSITSPAALTRPDANGANTELWGEVYTALGSNTNYTITATYTNQSGTGSRTATFDSSAYGALNVVGTMFPFRLQAGDTGVRSVQSVQLSGTSGSTGDWGLTIVRGLAAVPLPTAATPGEADAFRLFLPEIYDDAALMVAILCSTTSTGFCNLFPTIVDVPD